MKYYDLHTHTIYSDGSATVERLEAIAWEKGYGLGISDHLFCENMETLKDVENYLDALEGRRVLKGCEANIGEDYSMPDSVADRFDYVIASVHAVPDLHGGIKYLGSYFGERAGEQVKWKRDIEEERSEEYLEALLPVVEHTMSTQRMDIYGHCTVLPFCEILRGTGFLRDWQRAVLGLCRKYGVALEISGLWKEPELDMVLMAREMGVKFSLGSDCHVPKDSCNLTYAIVTAQQAGIQEEEYFMPKRIHSMEGI